MRGTWRRTWAAAAVAASLLAGCGGGKTFTAPEFVDEVKGEGVSIQLGEQLPESGPSDQVYTVTLTPLPGKPPPAPGDEDGPETSGSLYVYDGTGGADDEMEACRGSGGLLCYQAANVVVVLESNSIEAERLGVAIRKLAD
jgi:hypothetical protein